MTQDEFKMLFAALMGREPVRREAVGMLTVSQGNPREIIRMICTTPEFYWRNPERSLEVFAEMHAERRLAYLAQDEAIGARFH